MHESSTYVPASLVIEVGICMQSPADDDAAVVTAPQLRARVRTSEFNRASRSASYSRSSDL